MKIEQITESLRKRFCKDCNISMQLFTNPYFMERIILFGKLDEWKLFVKSLESYATEQDYFEEYNNVKDNIINFIKESEAFQLLQKDSMSYELNKYNLPDADVYKPSNVGRQFVSIDIRKANFSALVYYAKVNNVKFFDDFNWYNFMKQFTDNEHIINSKYIRQVVFGNCNPKRQVSYEKYIMGIILEECLNDNLFKVSDVFSLHNDEIIIDVTDFTEEAKEKLLLKGGTYTTVPLRVELYTLLKIKDEDIYIRKMPLDKFDIKKLNGEDAPQLYRFLNGEAPNENDLYFAHNGRLAKFMEYKEFKIMETQGAEVNG